MQEDYSHVFYRNCPHFTVGRVDQWGEQGYLFYEGKVFNYMVDRKEQYDKTYSPRSIEAFLAFANEQGIEIPEDFMQILNAYKGA